MFAPGARLASRSALGALGLPRSVRTCFWIRLLVPGVACSEKAFRDATGLVAQAAPPTDAKAMPRKVTLAGLEPAIFGSEDQRLIH